MSDSPSAVRVAQYFRNDRRVIKNEVLGRGRAAIVKIAKRIVKT